MCSVVYWSSAVLISIWVMFVLVLFLRMLPWAFRVPVHRSEGFSGGCTRAWPQGPVVSAWCRPLPCTGSCETERLPDCLGLRVLFTSDPFTADHVKYFFLGFLGHLISSLGKCFCPSFYCIFLFVSLSSWFVGVPDIIWIRILFWKHMDTYIFF